MVVVLPEWAEWIINPAFHKNKKPSGTAGGFFVYITTLVYLIDVIVYS